MDERQIRGDVVAVPVPSLLYCVEDGLIVIQAHERVGTNGGVVILQGERQGIGVEFEGINAVLEVCPCIDKMLSRRDRSRQ